ncbi:MAG: peptidoglycan DD-metalloendopeptidase family protein [Oscillospiraceae bacterium]|nr:peptidoglycan DD-metalloendopeptidase family protein [Oscillospiraceae bacterium]
MGKENVKRLLAFLLCGLLLSGSTPILPVYADDTTTEAAAETTAASSDEENRQKLKELQEQSEQLAEERKQIQSQISSAKSQRQQQQAIADTLDSRINNTISQITVLDQKVIVLKDEIAITEDHIATLQANIETNYELFLQRVRASYMYGDIKPMSVVLGADDYYDSLVAAKTIESVADHDNKLIEQLNSDKAEVEEALEQLEVDKKDLEDSIETLEEEKAALESELEATNVEIENFSKMEKEFQANLAANQKMSQELQEEMNAVFALINSVGEYVGGEMMWPVPGFNTISSYYGWRWNKTDYHTGIDITGSGVNKATIVAANSGTVAKVNTSYVPGKGYGIYVIIDHGGGCVSLYGHCSSVLVSEGQKVVKGTPIAKVGSTGWSTGPHLHFEVRESGQHVNPLGYLQG